MTPEQEERLEYLEGIVSRFMLHDRLYAQKNLQMADGRSLIIGGSSGTVIGQSTSKLAVLGSTPIAKQTAVSAPTAPGGTYSQAQVQTIVDAFNALALRIKNFGITA